MKLDYHLKLTRFEEEFVLLGIHWISYLINRSKIHVAFQTSRHSPEECVRMSFSRLKITIRGNSIEQLNPIARRHLREVFRGDFNFCVFQWHDAVFLKIASRQYLPQHLPFEVFP